MTRPGLRLCIVLAAVAVGEPAAARARVEPFDPFGVARIDPPAGVAPLDAPFRDADGRQVTLRQLAHGKPLVLAPVQHECPNLCGLTLEGLAAAVRGQRYRPGDDFVLVALGIDPREGEAQARDSLGRLAEGGPPSRGVHALVGPARSIAAVTGAVGYRYAWDPRIGQYAHVAAVAVLTPDGRLARWLYGMAPEPQDLNLAVTEAGQGRVGGLGEQIRLLCYHYDPETGRYSSLVWSALRWAGGAAAGGLALAIGAAAWRERRRTSGGVR